MVQKKLDYYKETLDTNAVIQKIQTFPINNFILDLKPFVTFPEREKLSELFEYIQTYCQQNLL